MPDCYDFILRQEQPAQKIMAQLHALFCTYPNVVDKIHYKVPFLFRFGAICYLNPRKKGVELVFVHGQQLSNEHGLLQTNNRKQVAGIFIDDPKKIPTETIITVWEEALLLDEQQYKSKKKKK